MKAPLVKPSFSHFDPLTSAATAVRWQLLHADAVARAAGDRPHRFAPLRLRTMSVPPSILVTGGSGYLGQFVVKEAAAACKVLDACARARELGRESSAMSAQATRSRA